MKHVFVNIIFYQFERIISYLVPWLPSKESQVGTTVVNTKYNL